MAEAAFDGNSYFFLCPFCEVRLADECHFKAHVEGVHELSRIDPTEELIDITRFVKAKCSSKKEHYEGLFLSEKMKILKNLLKENFPKYLENFKLWILCEKTKVDFDQEVREFFTPETILAHHEFLIDFMKEIRSINKGSEAAMMNASVSSINETSNQNIEALNSCKGQINIDPLYISLKRSLPDFETIYAMVTASAWENEQTAVNKAAIKLIHNVAEAIVRNILRTILLRRKNISVSKDGFIWNVDASSKKNPGEVSKCADVVTLEELLDCLVAHPKLIPIKAVYNFTVRRILNMIKRRPKGVPEEINKNT